MFMHTILFLSQMVNAVYGKTIENLSDRDFVKICRTAEELMHAVSKKTYKRQIIVNEEMVIVTQRKTMVYYNKPYYIGFSILDISKLIMYKYFYNTLRPYYSNPNYVQLLYSDTDSFILKIQTRDLFHDLKNLSYSFDFSNLPRDHCLYDPSNKSKLFHFKEEFALLPIYRVISLGSKVYSLQVACCYAFNNCTDEKCNHCESILSRTDDDSNGNNDSKIISKDKLVLKGISKHARAKFSFQDYFNCLQSQIVRKTVDFRIQSKNQELSSSLVQKIALSGFCDKRFIFDCGIHSVPYGMKLYSDVCEADECKK